MYTPTLSQIRVYPIKGLDPVIVTAATLGVHSLEHDRAFAIISEDGAFVNGKRTGKVNQLHAEYDLAGNHVTLSKRGSESKHTFELHPDNRDLLSYLSEFFGFRVRLISGTQGELMDVPKKGSISLVSRASLSSLLSDIPQLSLDDLRLRFRCNLEIEGVDPYWEEQLFKEPGIGVHFKIGDVELVGIRPRIRCSVPPRNPHTGETDSFFGKSMLRSRKESLPDYSNLLLHTDNMYYFALDSFAPANQAGRRLKVGDELQIIGNTNVDQWLT